MLLSSPPGCQTSVYLCGLLQLLSRLIADSALQLSPGSWLACKGRVEQGEEGLSLGHLHDTGTPGAITVHMAVTRGTQRPAFRI